MRAPKFDQNVSRPRSARPSAPPRAKCWLQPWAKRQRVWAWDLKPPPPKRLMHWVCLTAQPLSRYQVFLNPAFSGITVADTSGNDNVSLSRTPSGKYKGHFRIQLSMLYELMNLKLCIITGQKNLVSQNVRYRIFRL